MPRRIGLVGCVKTKDIVARPAKDLYTSPLFRGRRAYVERTCTEWWILSAVYGLVEPGEILWPYDHTLMDLRKVERKMWSGRLLSAIVHGLQPGPDDVFELHAGAEYRDNGLEAGLQARGYVVSVPTDGMNIGQQLAFYKGRTDVRDTRTAS